MLLAITGDGLLSQIPFLQPLLCFLQKSYVSMTLQKAAIAKDSAIKFSWIKIVCGVKIYDTMFILCFSLVSKQFWTNDNLYKVLRY